MPAHPRPTVRRRRLGAELKRLREAAQVKMEDAGAAVDGDKTKISRIENGRQGTNRLELEALFRLYGVEDGKLRTALITLARESKRKGWWHQFDDLLAPDMQERITLESDASRIYEFQPMLIPGLLQTKTYATAVISTMNSAAGEERIRSFVAVRMERQQIFERDDPPQYVCVLDEAVLHREIGGAAAMAEQLGRIIEFSRHPCVTVQVIPFSQGVHTGIDGPFDLYSYPDPMELDVVALDYLDGNLYLEDDGTVEKYRRAFDKLRAAALSSRQSMDLVSRIAQDLESKE
jgi:transcriptional regulator with XRE-family HTH domain